jgi:hypothetical protein
MWLFITIAAFVLLFLLMWGIYQLVGGRTKPPPDED